MQLKTVLFILLANLIWYLPASALEIVNTSCPPGLAYQKECTIQLKGKVESQDLLRMDNVGDVDQTSFKNISIGKTGYYLNYRYYARFVPRVYPLDKLVGEVDPIINVKIDSLLGPIEGFHSKTKISIISKNSPQSSVVGSLLWRLISFFIIGILLAYVPAFLTQEVKDGWQWSRTTLFLYFSSTLLFLWSMTETPRVFIPSLLNGEQYFLFHSLIALVSVWSLGRLLSESVFIDNSAVEKIRLREGKIDRAIKWGLDFVFISALVIVIGKIGGGFKFSHSLAHFLLCSGALALALLRTFRNNHGRILKRSRTSSILLFYGLVISGYILFWGAYRYEFRNQSMHWPSIFSLFSILVLAAVRKSRYRSTAFAALEFAQFMRAELRESLNGHERLDQTCQIIQERWDAARVSIISIKNEMALPLSSKGPQALRIDPEDSHTKMGPFLRRIVREKHILYAPVAAELGRDLSEYGLKFGSLGIPFQTKGEVEAVLFIMANEDGSLTPADAQMIEHIAGHLELEIISSIQQCVSEEQINHLRNLTAASSGIVLEHMDAWGRLPKISDELRRIVISADGINSTIADAVSSHSPHLANALTSYKQELYAVWFGLRSVFEFLSKDVRGDDFWAVSPKEFQNPTLKILGPEKVGLILAHLVEKHARMIAMSDEYRILGSPGAHVAVAAANLRFITLGVDASKCLDIESPKMSELHRIRSEAQPRSVLVDVSDEGMRTALNDANFFRSQDFRFQYDKKTIFKGLHFHPTVSALTGLSVDKREIRKLEQQALELAKESIRKLSA